MKPPNAGVVTLTNNYASLTVDPFGGAITAFVLKGNKTNPLSFVFLNEQMPENNKAGASYQGHFACIGRWGEPLPGEVKAGLPNHGEPANIAWSVTDISTGSLQMAAIAAREGLRVTREVNLDKQCPAYAVTETVTNINPLGRPFNIVQHPTLAAPFLDATTIIDCNASRGFDQAVYKNISSHVTTWPYAKNDNDNSLDLRNPGSSYNAVFSFVVNPTDTYGWITAYSQTHHLFFGYLWKRSQYPWIHLWQHYENDKIQYRGIEFGTAGIHQPFKEILDTATTLLGEKTYAYLDAGETVSKSYLSFIQPAPLEFTGVKDINISNGTLIIKPRAGNDINLKLSQTLINELSK